MNPGYPECLSSSFVDCAIIIQKVIDQPPHCESKLIISGKVSLT
jgi:hypothetical protein